MQSLFLIALMITMSLQMVNSSVICSEEELIRELKEDVADNGKLDCLRESYNEAGQRVERVSDWTSDCSFESEPTGK